MSNKLVKMVLFFLEGGEQPRHKVTSKIRNYPKEMRDDAIKHLVGEKLVHLREVRGSGLIGRTPVFISLTEKGKERALELSRKPDHNSVWGI